MSENTSTEKIIVVEDSPPNRKILAHLLTKLGYEVDSFEDGQKAWDFLNGDENKGNIVAVISDIMMPNMDGVQLLSNVRKSDTFQSLPFVLVTAVSDRDYIIEAKNLNVNGYILKPVSLKKIQSKLQDLFPQKNFPKVVA
ncbi:MAG: response regulator [Bdellovibrionales bacterium]|nr:response regulator [Bdellovibrionales bacterium]